MGKPVVPVFQASKLRAGFVPGQAAVAFVELEVEHVREVVEELHVELPPREFLQVGFELDAGGGGGVVHGPPDGLVDGADREGAEAQVLGEARGARDGGQVAAGLVAGKAVPEGGAEAPAGGFLAGVGKRDRVGGQIPRGEAGEWLGWDALRGRESAAAGAAGRPSAQEPLPAVGGVDPVGGAGCR